MTTSLVLFAYLQLLDLLTTVVFILHGVKEANPLVNFALTAAPTPLLGLLLVMASVKFAADLILAPRELYVLGGAAQ